MSSQTDTKLPEQAEKMLADMPIAERDWEALAVKTTELAMSAGETPANLLEAPLPAEEGEAGFERKEPAAPKAAPVSLADLARASVKKKNEGNKDIALESMAVASQARAQADEIAERVQAATRQAAASAADAEEAPTASAEPTAAKVTTAVPPVAVAAPPALPANVTVLHAPASRGPWIVAGVALLAAAAAIAISLRPKNEPPPLVVNQVTEAAPKSAAPAPAPTEPGVAAPTPIPAGELPKGEEVAQLPPVEGRPSGTQGPAPKSGAAAPSAASPNVKPEAVVLEDEEPATPPAAAPPASAKMVPAELPRGGLPDKPSAGAAYAAIGPFMGSARACVAGHDDPSTARIVFSSDGTVQSVSVSGAAAGTAAAPCIESAFKKARVQPFAAPTFSMSTVVRPQ